MTTVSPSKLLEFLYYEDPLSRASMSRHEQIRQCNHKERIRQNKSWAMVYRNCRHATAGH